MSLDVALCDFRMFPWTEKVLEDALSLNTFGNLSHAGDALEFHHGLVHIFVSEYMIGNLYIL